MGKDAPSYSRQCFYDTARRRVREARVLLEHPHPQKQRDGAVTVALLAAECALKAALLQGLQVNSINDLEGQPTAELFTGKRGHDLLALWRGLPPRITTLATATESDAMNHLRGADPYQHRYGLRKPARDLAEPLVDSAERLVQWMQKLPI